MQFQLSSLNPGLAFDKVAFVTLQTSGLSTVSSQETHSSSRKAPEECDPRTATAEEVSVFIGETGEAC